MNKVKGFAFCVSSTHISPANEIFATMHPIPANPASEPFISGAVRIAYKKPTFIPIIDGASAARVLKINNVFNPIAIVHSGFSSM